MTTFHHPVVAVSHGPGPLWLLSSGFVGMSNSSLPAPTLTTTFEKLYPKGENLPKRIFFIFAHWESDSSGFEISSAASPDMILWYWKVAVSNAVDPPARQSSSIKGRSRRGQARDGDGCF
ncbi:hypothetical protein PHYSODRAFT_330780 [Phytophthora sojae]|uniref:Uncharacterized protein n=1 Tax=Phytophthora sojae (strain P6497) TaxID=1094619 RepID=G4ZH53_PHYSP|nr:hypothetical protein PHYSODRAFT_330780 [Phytophthora sojae]EGZ16726.1 hypothetical protein PHYSODRAFT_330780 [Phytophthora sojae]|eukprot:XP_009525784.1 hypothetical protein PHYSODRAFT_330780 [Phytophthora sojae]